MNQFLVKLFKIAVLPLVFLVIIVGYNVILDPYGVILQRMETQATIPNERYIKTQYVSTNPKKYNSFLFGNSRVGKIDVHKLPNSGNWYNMAYSEGLPKEHLSDIEMFLKSGVDIKEIIIGVDEVSCFIDPKMHLNESLRKPYKNLFYPLIDYLLLKPDKGMFLLIREAPNSPYFTRSAYSVIFKNKGSFPPNKKDKYINDSIELHNQDSVFLEPYWPPTNSNRIDSTISDIKKIVTLCKLNNIQLTIFVNPIYIKTYQKAVEEGFLKFTNELSTVIDFYDFSGRNEITTNKFFYYENSHYRPIVGDIIIKELQQEPSKWKNSIESTKSQQ